MKIAKSDIIRIFGIIKAAYENAFFSKTESEINILKEFWYDSLKDYPKELVFTAVKSAIQASEFAPKISTVLAEVKKLTEANKKTDVELWSELEDTFYPVYRATLYLRYEQYHKWASDKIKQIYEKLSDEIKLYVVNSSTLKELATLANRSDDDGIKYEKARFLKLMPDLRVKQASRAEAKQFLQLCEANGINLIGGKSDAD